MMKLKVHTYRVLSNSDQSRIGSCDFQIHESKNTTSCVERIETPRVITQIQWKMRHGDLVDLHFHYRSRFHRHASFFIHGHKKGERWSLQKSKLHWKWAEELPPGLDWGFFTPLSVSLALLAANRSHVLDLSKNRRCSVFRNASATALTLQFKPLERIEQVLDEIHLREGDSFDQLPASIDFPRSGQQMVRQNSPSKRRRSLRMTPYNWKNPKTIRPVPVIRGEPHQIPSFDGALISGQWDRARGNRKNVTVLLLHGSGPENRESGSGYENRDYLDSPLSLFRALSQLLTKRGIDVFRFDKRGVGQSQGRWEQTCRSALVQDVEKIVLYLSKKRPKSRIVLMGLSEGANFAVSVARKMQNGPVSGVILAGGPSETLDRVMLEKMRFKLKHAEPSLKPGMKTMIQNWESVLHDLRSMKPSSSRKSLRLFHGYPLGWWFEMMAYRPLDDAPHLRLPILFLHGGMDSEVLAQESKKMYRAVSKQQTPKPVLKIFPHLNHFFSPSYHPLGVEYDVPTPIHLAWVQTLTQWIDHVF